MYNTAEDKPPLNYTGHLRFYDSQVLLTAQGSYIFLLSPPPFLYICACTADTAAHQYLFVVVVVVVVHGSR